MKHLLWIFIVLALAFKPAMASNEQSFDLWLKDVRAEALEKGISKHIVNQALNNDIKPIARIIELDRKQPENSISFQEYRHKIISKARVKKGRRMMHEHSDILNKISKSYGVPKAIIVALWGMETNYGGYTGGFSIVEALATLAYDGRRSEYFRKELFNALLVLEQGHITPKAMKGSWAGAMGQSQFMPSSFLNYAVDYNNDGKRDIWHTETDVFASAANYLIQHGWKTGELWGRQVQVPANMKDSLFDLKVKKQLSEWQKLGVRKIDGSALPVSSKMQGSLVKFINGADTETYLVYDNYRVIMKWNKSTYFATAIGLLSNHISY